MVREGKTLSENGLAALLGTTLLWSSSFPAIKIATGFADGFTYTWVRGLISLYLDSYL